jgi:RNA polymerase sigma-70 factor (ECF subfamily)
MNEEQSESKSQTYDPEAWVDQYGDYLYRYAISRIHEPATAEDLVQETLLAALQGKEDFKGRSSLKTWLTGILKYKIIDHIRKKSREQPTDSIELAADDMHEHFDDKGRWKVGPARWTVNPKELLEQKEFWKVVYECLSRLSERLAKVFALRELDGLSSQEVREVLNVSAANSYVMLYRARMHMRDCLEVNWLGQGKEREQDAGL